jgi:hypothetical protein
MNTKISSNDVEIQSDRDNKILSKRREHGKQMQTNAECFQQRAANPISRTAPEPNSNG